MKPLTILKLISLIFFISINSTDTLAQNPLNKVLNSTKKVTDKIDDVFGTKSKQKTPSKGKKESEQTVISESDFKQNNDFPNENPKNTRVKIAQNLALDINGKYPIGYKPKWRFINYKSDLDFNIENYIKERTDLGHGRRSIAIGDYNGKAVIRFGAFIGCDCYAEIKIDSPLNILTDVPQTFKVTNFQKITNERITGEPCRSRSNNIYTDGGWEGKITLSANEHGDISMDLLIENYRLENRFSEAGVSYRYIANNIIVENEMSASKAQGIIQAEIEAKKRQKDYIEKTTKQANELQKIIAQKYPQANQKNCFYSSRGNYISSTTIDKYFVATGDYAGSSTEYDWNIKTEIKNVCNYPLTFIGIQQLYDEQKGYYLVEVTKEMEKGYHFTSDQTAMETMFTSLIGFGSEFNFKLQDKYYPTYASVGAVQWIKVIKSPN